METKRILCAGSFAYGQGSTSWQRIEAIKRLGHQVSFIDTTPPFALRIQKTLFSRCLRRFLGISPDWGFVNGRLIKEIQRNDFDAFWIDKGTEIEPRVLKTFKQRFPNGQIIGYSPDDMMNPANKTKWFISSLPYYDTFFTTKSFHIEELTKLGCRRVQFVDNAYDEEVHRPCKVTPEDREQLGNSVIFVGSYEQQRAEFIRYLAQNGISVRVWGDLNWRKLKNPPPLMRIEYKSIFAEEYVKALCSSDISLCFLRKENRDLQTTRSIEIPACGTLMIAERTDEHLALFKEDKEAVYFVEKEELLSKVRYYLDHESERKAIAFAGRQRCLTGGYSNLERTRSMLEIAFR